MEREERITKMEEILDHSAELVEKVERILKDLDCHEICLCYFMKPKGQQFPSPDKLEKIQWIPIQDLKKHRIFPDFLPYFFTETDRGIQHFVTKN